MAQVDNSAQGKKAAAEAAVKDHVSDNMIIGIGSGSTIVYAIEKIAHLYHNKKITNITCVPTSFQSQQLILENNLPLGNLEIHYNIDIAIDGADEVDDHLNCIKGGGGCHLQEKMVAFNAKKFIIIADDRKQSKILGTNWKKGIPLSFIATSRKYIEKILTKQYLFECKLRMAIAKAGPVITDEGHMIFDVIINDKLLSSTQNLQTIDRQLHLIPGVVETGLFVNMADFAYFGKNDGSVTKEERKSKEIKFNVQSFNIDNL